MMAYGQLIHRSLSVWTYIFVGVLMLDRVPPDGYVIEPAQYAGFWLRIQADGHEVSFLLGEFRDVTELARELQATASITVKKVEE